MSKVKKLRIFAGPNGSGKSTLFYTFQQRNYRYGIFINSDVIEKEILEKGFLDLQPYGLDLSQEDLLRFCESPNAKTLLKKSEQEDHSINIEIRENIIVDKSRDTHSYEAALITSFIREHLLANGISYTFETVMSHPSKLDEIINAQRNGYRIYLYFICLDEANLNISRVNDRVRKGGHKVDPQKVKTRYINTLQNLYAALKLVDRAYLFDNSDEMLMIAEVENGELTINVEKELIPDWLMTYVINKAGS
ncbi:zeta toxin family protein [Chryseobacterium sp. MYb264]|uniref:zeta toxin family protein n=1 Tax=Chryseobacterium sp. MYb264 TaxID=2745153 RepID=UPI002E0EC412|nr:zeta toxin family protein [Chryseobacterium sp. MYb264]